MENIIDSNGLERLCIHTITTKPWSLQQAAENYSAVGIKGITVWRDAVPNQNPTLAKRILDDYGMVAVSYVRGGFFTGLSSGDREKAITENKKIIDEAADLGAPLIVLVCGATPGQSLETSRSQISHGIESVIEHASESGVRLGIEPLHPMYAGDRSAINTMAQANSVCEKIGHPDLGVVVDVFHLWWDDALEEGIKACGEANRLFAFHICDWKPAMEDMLNDRGLMGEGCIDIAKISNWVESTGFQGYREVEIFSNRYWSQDQSEYLSQITGAYKKLYPQISLSTSL